MIKELTPAAAVPDDDAVERAMTPPTAILVSRFSVGEPGDLPYPVARFGVPVTAGHVVAALYDDHEHLRREDIDADDQVWEQAGLVIAMGGLQAIEQRAGRILQEERTGTLAAPEWLAYCRGRVAAVLGRAWRAKRHRCSCGYATDDVTTFDDHLEVVADVEPEHFETLDGWDLEEVLAWRAAAGTGRDELRQS